MAAPRRHEDPVVQYAFRQYVAGNWTITEAATETGYSKSYMCRILHGERRKDAIRGVDPSSCAPTFRQAPRHTVCPYCDKGRSWIELECVPGELGQMTYRCPSCHRTV